MTFMQDTAPKGEPTLINDETPVTAPPSSYFLVRGMATFASYTFISRILGYVRDLLIARVLGAGTLSDVFFTALTLPNTFRSLFGEGAFNVAFVPLFAGTLEKNGKLAALKFANDAFSLLAYILLVFLILMEIFMPWVSYVFAPGFVDVPGKMDLLVELSRITFPYLLMIALVSLLSGILNSVGRFSVAAAAPILLNLTLIGALFGLSPLTQTPAHALAIGVFVAGVLQLSWLIWSTGRYGLGVHLVVPHFTPEMKKLFRRILPGVIGVGVYQINIVIGMIFASFTHGARSWLYYADRISQLPLGVIGAAIGTALLPLLSRQIHREQWAGVKRSQDQAMIYGTLLTLPAALGLLVLSYPIISLLFEGGAFTPTDTSATAMGLKMLSLGIPAFVLIKVTAANFYAREDTATPVKIAGFVLALNLFLNFIFFEPLGYLGIPLAATLSAWVNLICLTTLGHRRGFFSFDAALVMALLKIFLASLLMALVTWLILFFFLYDWSHLKTPQQVTHLIIAISGGTITFGGIVWMMGVVTPKDLWAKFHKGSPKR